MKQHIKKRDPLKTHRTHKYKQRLPTQTLRLMELANNLYNQAMFINRQRFFKHGKVFWYKYLERHVRNLRNYMPEYNNYGEMLSQTAQQTLKICESDWKSYLKASKSYRKDPSKFLGKPKLPRYKASGSRTWIKFTNQQCKIVDGKLKFPKRLEMEPIELYTIPSRLIEVRVYPDGEIEVVYEVTKQPRKEQGNIASIDLGLDNLATVVVNNNTKPLIINGKGLKAYNKYYNYLCSTFQSELKLVNDQNYSNKLGWLDKKRNNFMRGKLHKVSNAIVNHCVKNNVKVIVVGHNKGQKQENKLKNFVQVPIFSLIGYITYKAEFVGIEVITTEESYTSGTSWLDGELPTSENYDVKRRIKRGLFRSNTGKVINSDVNGAFQIIKKVFYDVERPVDNGFWFNPVKVNV